LALPTFQLDIPHELAERCPGLQVVEQELGPTGGPHAAARRIVAVLALVAASMIRRVGWLALVPMGAIPFVFNPYDALTVGLGAAWLVFAVLLLDREILAGQSRVHKLMLLGLIPASLLLNGWLSSGGPGDLRLNLAAIWSSELELRWGPAPI